jgi:phosphoribosylanthranilate isomerase
MTLVKICGLTDGDSVDAAVEAGADLLGFVFFPKSPRAVTPEAAAELLDPLPPDLRAEVAVVGLFVDPTDDEVEAVFRHLRLDILQLHGAETPERVEHLRLEFAVEVIKAVGVSTVEDLTAAEPFVGVADYLLFDAKPPAGAERPGGNAVSFPWEIMRAWPHGEPWLLAGGLTPETVAEAIRVSGAPGVDVSSGVETAPGKKDPARIEAFLHAVHG